MRKLILFFLMAAAFYVGVYVGYTKTTVYMTAQRQAECEIIDHALYTYSASKKTTAQPNVNNYPAELKDLGALRNPKAFLFKNIDVDNFSYKPTGDTNQMTYELGVHLPNGIFYKSTGSS